MYKQIAKEVEWKCMKIEFGGKLQLGLSLNFAGFSHTNQTKKNGGKKDATIVTIRLNCRLNINYELKARRPCVSVCVCVW